MENQKLAISITKQVTQKIEKEIELPYYFKHDTDFYKLISLNVGEQLCIGKYRHGITQYTWTGNTSCSAYDKAGLDESIEITADEYNSVRSQILLQLKANEL